MQLLAIGMQTFYFVRVNPCTHDLHVKVGDYGVDFGVDEGLSVVRLGFRGIGSCLT